MLLLVSVRAGNEVAAALAGGADIIDAKEPARGSLGPVSPEALGAIARALPKAVPLSVALGDFTAPDGVRRAVAGAHAPGRRAPTYVKLGFTGERSEAAVTSLVSTALEVAAVMPAQPIVVPVAYADHVRANSLAPEVIFRAAAAAGARAFLVDTCIKDGSGLLEWIGLGRLGVLSAAVRSAGLLLAVAGSLDPTGLDRVAGMADVVGVRGAACRGGREGMVDAVLVRRLRERLGAGRPLPFVAGKSAHSTEALADRESRPSSGVTQGFQSIVTTAFKESGDGA